MKYLLQLVLFSTMSLTSLAQSEDLWLETNQSYLGQKKEWEQEYHWGEPVYSKIRISVSDVKITVYAQNTFIVRVIERISYVEGYDAIFQGVDDEGIRCRIRMGTDRKSGEGFIAFEYSDLCFFYYAKRI